MGEETKPDGTARPRVFQVRLTDTTWLQTVERVGLDRARLSDLYHWLLSVRWREVFALVFAVYVVSNLAFAGLYLLGGDCIENARHGSLSDAFFFSVQTMATVGYGKMTPVGFYANAIVTLEALYGLLGTALVTGLMFARFARPTARVKFAKHLCVAVRDGQPSMFFRLANARGNQLVEASIKVTFSRTEVTAEGEGVRRFHDLALVRSTNPTFALSWTVVHVIGPTSPLYGATPERLLEEDGLLVISLVGIDETSGQTVNARHTYAAAEFVFGHRYADIIGTTADGRRRVDYTRFDDTIPQP